MFKEIFNMSLKNITSNKLRSALSILGILIGIASIIALLTIGQGVSTSVSEQLKGLGGNYITVSINTDKSPKKNFTVSDIEMIAKIPDVSSVSPSLHKYAQIRTYSSKSKETGGTSLPYAYVTGTSNHFFEKQKKGFMLAGQPIRDFDVDNNSTVCVLGNEICQKVFGNKNPVGETILINECNFDVVGVINTQQDIGGYSIDKQIYVPYTTAMYTNALNMGDITTLEVLVNDVEKIEGVYNNTNNQMMILFNGNKSCFKIVNQQAVMDVVVTISDLILGMLAGIAAISLLVGGIGIMNMMLVSVRERTSEIGLRKALGAKPASIMWQFVIESILISLIGGLFGVIVGIFLAYLGTKLIGAAFALKASTILLAAGFSIAVGLIFGILPARKAAKLNPIDALRSN